MADYVLSNKADADLDDIYVYSYRTFGEAKADAYLQSLSDCLRSLADNPGLGRQVAEIEPGLFRHRHARHTVYYLTEDAGIFIVRVLHEAMDAPRHIKPE